MSLKLDKLVESLLENSEFNPVSYNITGTYPLRELDQEELEAEDPRWIVHFPCGFETLQIAVYGDGLGEGDAIEAASEFLAKKPGGKPGGEPEEDAFAMRFNRGGKWQ